MFGALAFSAWTACRLLSELPGAVGVEHQCVPYSMAVAGDVE
jgi:hypothetical protein